MAAAAYLGVSRRHLSNIIDGQVARDAGDGDPPLESVRQHASLVAANPDHLRGIAEIGSALTGVNIKR